MSQDIILYTFPSPREDMNFSPFCMKLEVFLKIANIPHQIKRESNPQGAPKGKFPYIVDDGHKIGDSGLVVDYLKRKYTCSMDDTLSQKNHASGLLITRMLEEHLYFVLLYSRWVDDKTWPKIKDLFFKGIPFPLSVIVPNLVRGKMKKTLKLQGIGRHSESEILKLATDDLRALNEWLPENSLLFGDSITSYDITTYSFLKGLVDAGFGSPLEELALKHKKFKNYCEIFESKMNS